LTRSERTLLRVAGASAPAALISHRLTARRA
jgi:hypothetical protein